MMSKPIMADRSVLLEMDDWKITELDSHRHVFLVEKFDEVRQIRIGVKRSESHIPAEQTERKARQAQVEELIGERANLLVEEWPWSSNSKSGVFYYLMSIEKVS